MDGDGSDNDDFFNPEEEVEISSSNKVINISEKNKLLI